MPDQVLTAVSVRRVVKLTIQNLSGMGKNVLISANRRASLAFVFPARAQAVLHIGTETNSLAALRVGLITTGTVNSVLSRAQAFSQISNVLTVQKIGQFSIKTSNSAENARPTRTEATTGTRR